jgi:hypothetical protein
VSHVSQRSMPTDQRRYFILYAIWAVIVFILVFIQKGIETAHVAHGLVILFLGIQFLLMNALKKLVNRRSCRIQFLVYCLCCAALVEGFYMIHEPVFKAVKIVPSMSLSSMAGNYLVDLAFTLPVYLAVFSALWYFITLYQYTPWQYFIIFSAAQALGDGGVFFFSASPFLLLFIPYTLINYQAMNFLPYLLVRDMIQPGKTGWQKFVIPPLVIILIYLTGGAMIKLVGALFSLS